MRLSTDSRERILVVVRGHLGDLVQALPALRDLRRARASARITVLLNEYVEDALDGCPYVDAAMPGFVYRRQNPFLRAVRFFSLAIKIAGRFDTVIALRWSPVLMPMLSVLTGARVRVGFDRTGRLGFLLTHNLGPEPIDTVSNRVLNLLPLQAIGIIGSPSYSRIDWLPRDVGAQTEALLEASGVKPGSPYCAVQLSSHWGCSEWRSDKWAALCEHLAERHGLTTVVAGTAEWFELAKLESVRRRSRAPLVSLLGRTSIPQLFEVVRRASLIIGGDTGLAQIALAQGIPAVVMFGIEEIEANGPLPDESGSLIRTLQRWDRTSEAPSNPHCAFGQSHCHGRYCTEDYSRRNISVDDVAIQIEDLIRTPIVV